MFWDTLELNFRVALGHDGKIDPPSVPTSDAQLGRRRLAHSDLRSCEYA
jgi:hypothetical protein